MSSILERKLARLEAENEELREKVEFLSAALTPPQSLPIGLHLSASEERLLLTLAGREWASFDVLSAALYWDKEEPRENQTIRVFVQKVRTKLKPFGITIKTRWGTGYYIEPEDRAKLKQLGSQEAAVGTIKSRVSRARAVLEGV